MTIKVCGITRVADAIAAADLGVHAVGFVFWPGSPRAVSPAQARELVRLWGEHDVLPHSAELVLRSISLHLEHSVACWDALIVQAALDAKCNELLTEDMQHGRRFGELEIVNPFLASSAHEGTASYRARRSSARSKRVGRASPVARNRSLGR